MKNYVLLIIRKTGALHMLLNDNSPKILDINKKFPVFDRNAASAFLIHLTHTFRTHVRYVHQILLLTL